MGRNITAVMFMLLQLQSCAKNKQTLSFHVCNIYRKMLKSHWIDFIPGVTSKTRVIGTKAERLKAIATRRIKTFDYARGLCVTVCFPGQTANNQTVCVSMSPLGHTLMRSDP